MRSWSSRCSTMRWATASALAHQATRVTGGLLERGAQLGEDALVGGCDLLASQLGEAAQQIDFFFRESGGDLDVDPDQQVPAASASQRWDPDVFHSEQLPRLGAGRDEHLVVGVEAGDREAGAERGLGHRDLPDVEQIVAVAFEVGMDRDADGDVQVAGDPAAGRRGAATGEAEALTVTDPGGDFDVDAAVGLDPSVAAAVAALGEDAAAGGLTDRARCGGDDLAEDRSANLADLTGAAAHVAAGGVGARLAARAVAAGTADRQRRVDGLGLAEHGVGEGELDDDFGVTTTGRGRRAAAGPERVTGEEGVEEVSELERLAANGAGRAGVAEDVVAAPPFGVAQGLVGDADLLEALFGVGRVGLRIGVVAAGEVTVRAFDVFVAGV